MLKHMVGVAKFPKNVKASNAFNFLENVKVSKSLFILLLRNKKMNFKWLNIITRNEAAHEKL
jgi:hypothetical protein